MKNIIPNRRLLSLALVSSTVLMQLPALASTSAEGITNDNESTSAPVLVADIPVKVRATEEVNSPSSVLSGHVNNEVETLSKDVLRDEIKLERFNLNYRLNAAKQGWWKGRRFFMFQETDLLATDGALITGTASHMQHIHHGGGSANVYANGALLPYGAGNCFAACGDALEIGINGYHSWEAGKNGYGSRYARDYVVKLVAEIDNKLAERDKLVSANLEREQAELEKLEGNVLADFRDLGIAKFEQIHSGAKKTLASQNSFYLLDIGTKTTGALGAFFGMHAYLQGHGGFVVPCGIMNTISGGEVIINPILSKLLGDMARDHDRKNLEKHGLKPIEMACGKLDDDWDAMEKFCKNHQVHDRPDMTSLVNRLDAYDSGHTCIVDEISAADSANRKGRKTSIQGLLTATVVGSSLSAFGIGVTIAGANYLHDAVRFNSNIGWAYLQLTPAISYAALDNLRIQMQNEVSRHRQAKSHTLPSDLINKRFQQLDAIEKKI